MLFKSTEPPESIKPLSLKRQASFFPIVLINRLISFAADMSELDKRTSILKVAEKVFCQYGYEGTSTRMLAKEAGINIAMIHYYFGSKEGVFVEMIKTKLNESSLMINSIELEAIGSMEKLFLVIEVYVERFLGNAAFYKLIHRELSLTKAPKISEKFREFVLNNIEHIENILNEGIANGDFRKVDTRMLIATIIGTINYVVISPYKVSREALDINKSRDMKLLKQRTLAHLKDLVKNYLILEK